MTNPLAPSYDPGTFESRLYAEWEAAGVFAPRGDGPAYTILLPPPNVTGTLHMGHAFQHTLQDALVRYHRMRGYRTLWQMGTDHAGIATEMVVSRNLALAGKGETRDSLGREGFIEKVWEWKQQSGDTIERQMRRLGTSGDWTRSVFTMDAMPSAAVIEAFVRLHEKGLIYRGKRLVNWDPVLQTAVSDLEVVSEEEDGFLWSIRYPLADGASYEHVECDADGHETLREMRDYLVVATTRPETMLGDTAVMVHPDDARYASLVGKAVQLPLTDRLVPIIADDYVDRDFGTGVVKVTPAHDFNDYAVGQRHGLPMINLFTDIATVNDNAPQKYRGLDRYDARKAVLADLDALALLVEEKAHKLQVPRGDRSGQVIEPYLTDQWFVAMDEMGRRGMALFENGSIRFVPPNWINTYRHWMENIQDWTISRQLWWGHRIPAWFDDAGNVYVARNEEDAYAQATERHGGSRPALRQDSDVLETWFSSALWPFSTLGWPDADAMRERGFDGFLPTSVLVTGFDIIFFWVARMVMMTDALTGKVAFDDVYITGLVRDKDGQKMSKSKGNILDPLDIIDGISADALVAKRTTGLMKPKDAPKIEKATRKEFPDGIIAHGADPLRFTMAALAGPGRDIKFDLGRAEGYKNFCNKLWNATRFVLMNTEGLTLPPQAGEGARRADGGSPASPATDAEKWILSRLAKVAAEAEAHFAAYRFDLLAQSLYEFAWNEFCDWFVELAKPALNGTDPAAADSTRRTLLAVLEALLRLLHPLIPFVTEELWRQVAPRLGIDGNTVSLQRYPQAADFAGDDFARAEADIEWLKQMVTALRRIRSELGVSPSRQVPLLVQAGSEHDGARLARFDAQLKFLNRLERVEPIEGEPPPAAAGLVGELKLFVPLEGLVDLDAERTRLDKEIARVSAEKDKSGAKLAKFSDKVPAAVVEQERQRLADWTAQLDALTGQRTRLG
ncbi:valine--tRNA ligase [Luteimonas aestuarii]|uniref:Valine--tRNA ligase n=1 Tax=Luteimonas aestuarii TaxID=453837 RepID=A0A4R5TIA8_9GAMM|nr:valine--tRNA ligase [Luteimonas aestuarii]TDK19431.1 valine--tRNA ligase [Luteimonas aestuarii]